MSTAKCRILYIDDHEDSAEMLRVLLSEDEDYEVITASSVRAALELIRTETFDLYVLDRRLPRVLERTLDSALRSFLGDSDLGNLDFLAVQDKSWADLTRCRERDECREKLVRLGILATTDELMATDE